MMVAVEKKFNMHNLQVKDQKIENIYSFLVVENES